MNIQDAAACMREGKKVARPIMGHNFLYADEEGRYIQEDYQTGEGEWNPDCDELEADDWEVITPGEQPWDRYGERYAKGRAE